MTVIGHGRAVRTLEQHLPAVTLLLGPRSVGKTTLAEHLAKHHGVLQVDRMAVDNTLTIDVVRSIINFVGRAPFGKLKLVTASLDRASEASLNAFLKTLEEPPPTARFILTCSGRTLPTILSRAAVVRLGLLSTDDLTRILVQQGMTPDVARHAAKLGRGQVDVALKSGNTEKARSAVLAVMRAVAAHDVERFHGAFKTWDDLAGSMLAHWFQEAISGHWALFTEAETFGLRDSQIRLRRMLVAVSQNSYARSRLGVRAALEPFVAQS